ncbi:MAG: hypothetical protein H7Y36_11515 [Armatimonadetes bacterium]|nr:hypothetical protein [Akkermansiaceae bacterium]
MDFIFDNIYVLVLVAAGIAQWLKSRREAKQAEREASHGEREEDDVFGPDFDFGEMMEEHKRQAELGVPDAVAPPPLPVPLPELETRRTHLPSPGESPSIHEREFARQNALADQMRMLKLAKSSLRPEGAAGAKARVALRRDHSTKAVAQGGGLDARLRSRSEIKKAFILKEILDAPLGLRK